LLIVFCLQSTKNQHNLFIFLPLLLFLHSLFRLIWDLIGFSSFFVFDLVIVFIFVLVSLIALGPRHWGEVTVCF